MHIGCADRALGLVERWLRRASGQRDTARDLSGTAHRLPFFSRRGSPAVTVPRAVLHAQKNVLLPGPVHGHPQAPSRPLPRSYGLRRLHVPATMGLHLQPFGVCPNAAAIF